MTYHNISEIINSDCIRYFNILKNNQYLVIFDYNNNKVVASFFKRDNNNIFEYFHLYNAKNINEYKTFKYPLSFFFRNEPLSKTYIYDICDENKFINYIKNNIKNNLDKELKKDDENNAILINNEINLNGGKFISFGSDINDKGLLVCATATDEDYYWCYVDNQLNIKLSSCVGGFDILDENEINKAEFNMLKYIIENKPNDLKERIIEHFNNKIDYIFTNIKIN